MPFHLGPGFLGTLLFRVLGIPTFLIASLIVDMDPFLALVLNPPRATPLILPLLLGQQPRHCQNSVDHVSVLPVYHAFYVVL